MNDFTPLEPLTPEDLNLLVGLAQPLFAESKQIERFTSDNPVKDGMMNDGSEKIKTGLEQMQRQVVKVQPFNQPPPQPYYHPPQFPNVPSPIYTEPNHPVGTPINYGTNITPSETDQLEFNFNLTEQKKTNDLLEKILKKLTRVISLLESKEHVKSELKYKGIQPVSQ